MRAWWYDSPVSTILPRGGGPNRPIDAEELIENLRLNVIDELNRSAAKGRRRQLIEILEICTAARRSATAEESAPDILNLLRAVKTGQLDEADLRPLFLDLRHRSGLPPLSRPPASYVMRGAVPSVAVLLALAAALAAYHESVLATLGVTGSILGLPTDALAYIVAGSATGVMLRVFLAVNGDRDFRPHHPGLLVMAGALRPVFGLVVGLAFAVLYANFGGLLAGAIKIFAEVALALAGDEAAQIYGRLYGVATRVDAIWSQHFMSPPLFFVVTAFFTAYTRLAHQVVERAALAAVRIRNR